MSLTIARFSYRAWVPLRRCRVGSCRAHCFAIESGEKKGGRFFERRIGTGSPAAASAGIAYIEKSCPAAAKAVGYRQAEKGVRLLVGVRAGGTAVQPQWAPELVLLG